MMSVAGALYDVPAGEALASAEPAHVVEVQEQLRSGPPARHGPDAAGDAGHHDP
jgi:hypothetical protein